MKFTTIEDTHRRGRGNIDKVEVEAKWDEAYRWECPHCSAKAIFTDVHDAVMTDKLHPCPELVHEIEEAVEYREWVVEQLTEHRDAATSNE